MDVFDKCRGFERPAMARALGLYPYFRAISSGQDPVVEMDGKRVVMLGSNNYLGLASHPLVKQAAQEAIAQYGTGCAGSRFLNGTLDLHVELEERLAVFMRREAALTFPTGFQVNVGVLSCLLGRHDVALLDSLDHACIMDGARLGFSKVWKFRHNDTAHLEQRLKAAPENRGRLIVVDGVYSMEGDLCPLPEVTRLRDQYDARLMVDDAHGLGVFGEHGRGVGEHFGVEGQIDLVMGTFSKSLASIGGFVAGDAQVIEYIKHHARTEIFSAAMPPAAAAAVLAALDILEREPERRKQLWENTHYMMRELQTLGFDTGAAESPVIPLVLQEEEPVLHVVAGLLREGVFANAVIPPAVEEGRCMVRTSYMATHTREHLDQCLDALRKVGREVGVI
ncbi:MAG: pyridoxal phosphate-dependent aminotransferase family protein [Myxococcota bacterium]|nr:pyridoxal phosphate-dependent aminotransferase family protein [Myxococcota bacterium]